ncbi:CHAT domain-containing protein [Aspergillus foveolatus]|uniref:CHAT domain-containing protein n=1 Tax=Aspergillus foveolatus TaxID=210207 RepID=UPI003CCC99E3
MFIRCKMDSSSPEIPNVARSYPVLRNVLEALDNSTLYIDRRGNFKTALEIAQHSCTLSRPTGGGGLAAALISCGIVHTLQGNCKQALSELNEANSLEYADPALQYLAYTYIYVAKMINYDMLPDTGTGHARDIQYRFDKIRNLQDWNLRCSKLPIIQTVDPVLHRECELLNKHRCWMTAPRQGPHETDALSTNNMQILLSGSEEDLNYLANIGTHQRGLSSFQNERAKLYYRYFHKQEATQILDSARAYYDQTNDMVGLGNIELTLGDWLAAPFSCPEVWNSYLEQATSDNSLHWQVEAAEAAIDRSSIAEARRHYEAALRLFTTQNALRGVAAVRLRLGYLSALKGLAITDVDFEKHFAVARQEIQAAAAVFHDTEDIMAFQLCQAHLSLCDVGEKQGPDDLQRAVNIGQWGCTDGSFGYALGIGLLFARMARRWMNHIGDYERAFTCFRLAEALFKHLGAGLSHIHAIADQMNLYKMLGDFPSFSRLALVALDECEALHLQEPNFKDRIEELSRWILISIIGTAMGRNSPTLIDHALDYVSAHLGTDLPDKATKFPSLGNIATALSGIQVSEDPEAISKAMHEALTAFNPHQMAQEMLMSAVTDSKVYKELYRGMDHKRAGNADEARECFRSVRTKAQVYDDSRRYHLEALAYAGEGDYVRASTANKMSLKLRMKDFDLREEAGESTRLDADSRRHAAEEALMASVQFNDYQEAGRWMHFLNEHFPDWWESKSPPWEALYYMGQTQEGIGDLGSALTTYEDAISTFERHRASLSIDELKVAFSGGSTTQKMFFAYTRTLFRMRKQPESSTLSAKELEAKIFEVVERGKARSLLDLMQGGLMGSGQVATSSAFRRWRQLHASRSMHCTLLEHKLGSGKADREEVTQLKDKITNIEAQIQTVEREMQSSGTPAKPVTAEVSPLMDVANNLPDNKLILQYFYDYNTLFSWAISNEGMVKVVDNELGEYWLGRVAKKFHDACDEGVMTAHGEELSDTLLRPFTDLLEQYTRLIIVPHGSLHLVPFHVLPFKGKPLVLSHVVTYLPSSSIVRFIHQKGTKHRQQSVLALGNPSSMRITDRNNKTVFAPRLPGAGKEAQAITVILPESKALLSQEATLDNLRKYIHNYPILHLATHCKFDPEVPLLSSICLAYGRQLSVLDLLDLHLDVDLVIFSACQTAQGTPTAGDDIVGFARALFAAGAHAVMVSLWPVDDSATSEILIEFYKRLSSGRSAPVALQEAQVCFINEHAGSRRADQGNSKDMSGDCETQQSVVRRMVVQRDITNDEKATPTDYSLPAFWGPFILMSA